MPRFASSGDRTGGRKASRGCQISAGVGDFRVVEVVTPNEIARTLGVTGLTFRNWLRAEKAAGHPLLATHEYRTRYRTGGSPAGRATAARDLVRAEGTHAPIESVDRHELAEALRSAARTPGGGAAIGSPLGNRSRRTPFSPAESRSC